MPPHPPETVRKEMDERDRFTINLDIEMRQWRDLIDRIDDLIDYISSLK